MPEGRTNDLAQFLTYSNKIVVDQYGNGATVFVRYRGARDFVPVSGADWKKNKAFVRYDSAKMDRLAAYAMYEVAQQKKSLPMKEQKHALRNAANGPDQTAGRRTPAVSKGTRRAGRRRRVLVASGAVQ